MYALSVGLLLPRKETRRACGQVFELVLWEGLRWTAEAAARAKAAAAAGQKYS